MQKQRIPIKFFAIDFLKRLDGVNEAHPSTPRQCLVWAVGAPVRFVSLDVFMNKLFCTFRSFGASPFFRFAFHHAGLSTLTYISSSSAFEEFGIKWRIVFSLNVILFSFALRRLRIRDEISWCF